jgi:hypothetical protein
MPADNDLDPLDRWLSQPVWPMSPPDGTFDRITKQARRRRARRTITAVASAAAAVAAIGVAVPLSLSSTLGPSPSGSNVAAGSTTSLSASGSQSVEGTATHRASPNPAVSRRPSSATSSAPSTSTGPTGIASPGYLPGNFVPSSVTWVSSSDGYVIGQAGTPGTCGISGNSDICTSMAVTHDAGKTWKGVNPPLSSAASGTTGVSGVRFLNGDDGWVYGPELWYTANGSAAIPSWTKADTGGQIVTDLETAGDQAFAIFATCPPAVSQASIAYACTSFTLKTSVAGSSTWTGVSGIPAALAPNPVAHAGRAELVLANSAGEGFLVTPQNVLYTGPLNGGAWHSVGALPCTAFEAYLNNSIARPLLLATAGLLNDGQVRLALSCSHTHAPGSVDTSLWTSNDSGQHWTRQPQLGSAEGGNDTTIGIPASMTAVGNQSVILATSKGIYYVPLSGGTKWQGASLGGSVPADGFSYVGMTNFTQGVAIGDPAGTRIWMTSDGGQSWRPVPIQS